MDRRVPMFLLAVLTSGCVEHGTLSSQDDDVEAQPSYVPVLPPTVAETAREPLWATNHTGDLALRLRFSVPEPADCNLTLGTRSKPTQSGPKLMTVFETSYGKGHSSAAFGEAAHVHVFDTVDTRRELRGRMTTEGRYFLTNYSGPVHVFIAVTDLGDGWNGTWSFVEGHETASFYVGFSCRGDERVSLVQGGTELLLVDPESMDGGVGASALLLGAAAYENTAESAFAQPHVLVQAYSRGHKATLRTTHAQGEDVWDASPSGPADHEFWATAGDLQFKLTTAGVAFESFIASAAGLEEVETLDDLTQIVEPSAAPDG